MAMRETADRTPQRNVKLVFHYQNAKQENYSLLRPSLLTFILRSWALGPVAGDLYPRTKQVYKVFPQQLPYISLLPGKKLSEISEKLN